MRMPLDWACLGNSSRVTATERKTGEGVLGLWAGTPLYQFASSSNMGSSALRDQTQPAQPSGTMRSKCCLSPPPRVQPSSRPAGPPPRDSGPSVGLSAQSGLAAYVRVPTDVPRSPPSHLRPHICARISTVLHEAAAHTPLAHAASLPPWQPGCSSPGRWRDRGQQGTRTL